MHKDYSGQGIDQLADVVKKIYQSRPDLVLSVGNEYLTLTLMEELGGKYLFSISCHFYIFITYKNNSKSLEALLNLWLSYKFLSKLYILRIDY